VGAPNGDIFSPPACVGAQWREKRQKARLSTANDVLRTVDCLVTGSLDPVKNDKRSFAEKSASLVAAEDQDSADALSSSAERAAALIAMAEHSKYVAQFFSLVFMAECRVALFTGCSETSVYNAIRKFLEATGGTCDGDKTPALLLSTTLWVLQERQRQFRRGLLHRGLELFFNGKWASLIVSLVLISLQRARIFVFILIAQRNLLRMPVLPRNIKPCIMDSLTFVSRRVVL
jgi:hypothetical protein